MGLFFFLSGSSKIESKDDKLEDKVKATDIQLPAVDDKLVEAVVERVKAELPALIETIGGSPPQAIAPKAYDAVYTSQIAKAQEFLNENRSADLSRMKCLLHKLLPKEYFDLIEQLREHQDPQFIFHIHGGHNLIAPKAKQARQDLEKK